MQYGFTTDSIFKIDGKQHYLWRAVDQDREIVDVYLQKRRDGAEPRKIVTDKLRSYNVAHREIIPDSIHDKSQYANNRAKLSHQPTRVRERGMRRFKSTVQAQQFLGVHSVVYNLFNLGRHLISARHYRLFRKRVSAECSNSKW